ncbi:MULTISPECIES: hypothetical protein [unclassified Burkholderia]|uniref:hypothetical protein n=1 Tax=unclassified Burkholderia TaxID=2613784 RepID=UPI002AB225A7|nr:MULTISPECIES: hypothetical protein [unclassified Burkholderia]
MGWHYTRAKSHTIATHQPSDLQITVTVDADKQRTYAPTGPIAQRMAPDEVDTLLRDLKQTLLNEDRRAELRTLINEHLGRSNSLAVSAINSSSGREPISERTVQSWLIESHRVSNRPCPEWALVALRAHVSKMSLSEREHLKGEAARRLERPAWLRVDETHVVDYATHDIEWDRQIEGKWRKDASPGLAHKLAELEIYQAGFMHGQNTILSALTISLRNSATFEEFKLGFVERYDNEICTAHRKRQVRRDIEGGTGEFSTSDDESPE